MLRYLNCVKNIYNNFVALLDCMILSLSF